MSKPQHPLRLSTKAAVGLLAGLFLWWGGSPVYNRLLAVGARPLVNILHGEQMAISPQGRDLLVSRAEAPSRIRDVTIPISDLTINIILLTTLFSLNRRALHDRNVVGFALAALILFAAQIPAVVAKIETFYVLQPEPWVEEAYPGRRGDIWLAVSHFYQMVGMYALAIVCWWLLRPESQQTSR